jgi:alkanesulfonate monooxygenase SsuD/methylene tetrahydromethanopterin reductase-like flavin-dependent oxidoreductase (luciferase family)
LAAALTEETARRAGGWADGLITVAGKPEPLRRLVDAFRAGGGEGKPLFLQAALSYAKTDGETARAAHLEWRQAGLDPGRLADLRTPDEFAAACARVTEADVRERLRVSSDPGRHAEWLARDLELGFSDVYLHNVGRNQEEFIETFAARVLPSFR